MNERTRLINQTAKEVYKKAVKNVYNNKWKDNYERFINKIVKDNGNIWIQIKKSKVFISDRWLKDRYLINPRYKIDWYISPQIIALLPDIIKNIPYWEYINKKTGAFKKNFYKSQYNKNPILFEDMMKEINQYIKEYKHKYSNIYLYKLTPDIIWVIHSIVKDLYDNWTIVYKFK